MKYYNGMGEEVTGYVVQLETEIKALNARLAELEPKPEEEPVIVEDQEDGTPPTDEPVVEPTDEGIGKVDLNTVTKTKRRKRKVANPK